MSLKYKVKRLLAKWRKNVEDKSNYTSFEHNARDVFHEIAKLASSELVQAPYKDTKIFGKVVGNVRYLGKKDKSLYMIVSSRYVIIAGRKNGNTLFRIDDVSERFAKTLEDMFDKFIENRRKRMDVEIFSCYEDSLRIALGGDFLTQQINATGPQGPEAVQFFKNNEATTSEGKD